MYTSLRIVETIKKNLWRTGTSHIFCCNDSPSLMSSEICGLQAEAPTCWELILKLQQEHHVVSNRGDRWSSGSDAIWSNMKIYTTVKNMEHFSAPPTPQCSVWRTRSRFGSFNSLPLTLSTVSVLMEPEGKVAKSHI